MSIYIIQGISRNCTRLSLHSFMSGVRASPKLYRAFAVGAFSASNQSNQQLALHRSSSSLLVRAPLQVACTRHSSEDHAKHWKAERILAVGLLLTAFPAVGMFPGPISETYLALCLCTHSYWGLQAVVIDYIRPSIFGEVIPKVSLLAVAGVTMMAFGGLCYYIYNDIGIANTLSMIWKL